MPSRFTAQSGKGVLLVALALVATLLVPSVYTWAVKPQIDPDKGSEKLLDDKATFAYFQRMQPVGHPRPLGIAPVPDALAGKPLPAFTKRDGLLWTGAGYINPKNPNALKDVPEDLRGTVVHKAPVGKGFGLSDGVGIIQISKAALSSRPWDDIEGEIRRLGARILTTIPERGAIVAGDHQAMASLVQASFVEASMPYPEAAKLSADIGRMQLINKARANRSDFDLNVRTWHGFDVGGALADVQKIVGKDRASLDVDGLTIKATASSQEAKRIAKIAAVSNIEEDYEYILNSFVYVEYPPVIQVGENEHTFSATPYWDAGVDGGGCGHCATKNNTACTTNANCAAAGDPLPICINADAAECTSRVPATLVAITDNGASTDSASLSNTNTALSEAAILSLISTNDHRKIAKYI